MIARELGDVPEQCVWRFLRAQKIDLSGRKSWCESNDAEFVAKAAEIVGLSMAPPEHAVLLAIDKTPSIQALERAQGYLRLPTGRAMTGSRTITGGMEPRRCLPPSTSPPARWSGGTTSGAAVSSFSTS